MSSNDMLKLQEALINIKHSDLNIVRVADNMFYMTGDKRLVELPLGWPTMILVSGKRHVLAFNDPVPFFNMKDGFIEYIPKSEDLISKGLEKYVFRLRFLI